MSEPFTTADSFDSTPSVPAPGPDTIRTLDAPVPATQEPEGEPEAAPQGPSWNDRNAAYQKQSAAQRRISGRYHRELQDLRTRLEESTTKNNDLLRAAIEALQRQGGGQQQEEAIPDPLSPEFGAWLRAQIAKGHQEQLKPVIEGFQQQQQLLQQQEESRQREELAAAQSREEAEWLQGAAFEYESQAPDISYGHEDRFHTVRDGIVTPAFQSMGHSPEDAAHLANSLYNLIAKGEARQGRNPVAAIDAFNSSLVMRVTQQLADAGILESPWVPVSADGAASYPQQQPAYQPQPAVNPQQAEIQRQEAVRRRTAPAGSAAPRMAARGSQPKSEAAQLFAAGVHLQPGGWARIQQAALREAGGNGQQAAILMQQFAG
jgi:hypothetical protein